MVVYVILQGLKQEEVDIIHWEINSKCKQEECNSLKSSHTLKEYATGLVRSHMVKLRILLIPQCAERRET